MRRTELFLVIIFVAIVAGNDVRAGELSAGSFAELRQLIKPQPNESRWRHVPWQTSLHGARQKAAAEGKPLLIWSGGGSAPLGGC